MPIVRRKVLINTIHPSPFQQRQVFNEEKLKELMQSIAEIDLLEPIILRSNGESEDYQLVAGERRLRACQQVGMEEVDAIIHENISDFKAMLISGSENLHREDLTSVEKENLINVLWKMGKKEKSIRTQGDLAKRLGMSQQNICNILASKEFRDSTLLAAHISTRTIVETQGLLPEERTRILERVAHEEIAAGKIREYVNIIKKASKSVKKALLTPGSKLTPEIAMQIDKGIHTERAKHEAIVQIEEQVHDSIERSVETIIEDTRRWEKEHQQELGQFIELNQEFITETEVIEEVDHGRIPFTAYDHVNLDGTTRKRIWKVGDSSIIEVFSATPDPKSSSDVVCPHFMKLKWALGCPYECAWCYLQGTLRFQPEKTKPQFKDRDKIARHVEYFLHYSDPEILNTGELSDSLMDEDGEIPFSKFIIDLVKEHRRDKPHKVLFLSKSSNVKHLLEAEGQDVAICSFTINAIPVARRWEKKAASVEKRLEAAQQLKDAGYEVRLRIDPMVPVEDWRKAYTELVDLVFEHLTPDRITLGSPRGLQSTINNARDTSWTKYLGEKSNWGLKVPFNTRLAMYRAVINRLRKKWKYSNVGLCKETLAMWAKLNLDYQHPRCNCVY